MQMDILYQGFQVQKERDYVIYIWKYLLLLLMKYQWFRIPVYFIYITDYVKHLAAQKVNYLQINLILFLVICYSCHQLNHPKNLKIFGNYNSAFSDFFNL